jgi:hypothetical protein
VPRSARQPALSSPLKLVGSAAVTIGGGTTTTFAIPVVIGIARLADIVIERFQCI